ncbi:hypothetical protein QBC47DRAFT_369633 [Echria macrotheca]|uniref:Uncharacterized protein n=1 Tax=Echria macrotheca TaxID=438768 RepID=A0AAJ0BSP0_9PEZI|nr:hypothetical protein QBC47DRAFT_369633 [Echria macrotheca]
MTFPFRGDLASQPWQANKTKETRRVGFRFFGVLGSWFLVPLTQRVERETKNLAMEAAASHGTGRDGNGRRPIELGSSIVFAVHTAWSAASLCWVGHVSWALIFVFVGGKGNCSGHRF